MERGLTGTLRNSRWFTGPAPWIAIGLVLLNLGASIWREELEAERKANLLIRTDPGGTNPSRPPRYDWSAGQHLAAYWSKIPDARVAPLVVLTGMSQMYAINEPQPADQTISEWMDDVLSLEGIRVFGLAAPNLNNEEALVYLTALANDPATTPSTFVYGACFDKTRNVDVRPDLLAFLRSQPKLQSALHAICAERSALHPMACEKMSATLASLRQTPATGDEQTIELRIRNMLGRVFPLVSARGDINVQAQLGLYLLRNWIFQIEPSSKRPVIKSRYELNQDLLELLIEVATDRGITIALYVIPLNPQAENPYVPAEYERFKQWIEALARSKKIAFANLESVVPATDWGELLGGPDFKHFKGAGHRATANAIVETFRPVFREAAARKRSTK